jgi:peroxiredoxin
VYFFAADWCPQCHETMAEFRTRTSELPDNLTIVVVNYDTARALRTKYAIPVQDVLAEIDSQGRRLVDWVGGGIAGVKKRI